MADDLYISLFINLIIDDFINLQKSTELNIKLPCHDQIE